MVLWMSFSDLQAAYIDRPLPTFFSFDHFIEIFTEVGILRYFGNTFLVAAFTGILTRFFTFPAAHAVARMRPAAAGRLFSFIQMLGLLGGIHALIPLFIIFRHLGLINTFVPVVLIYLMHAVPFSLFTISSYLEHIPKEFEEISRLEGATPLRYLISVLLPLSLPIIATSVMVAFIGAWNGFLVPLIFLQDDSLFTIGVKLHEFVGSIASGTPRWGAFAATSMINMLFIGLLFYRFKNPLRQNRLAEQ
ncbi:MAG: carbohydrate ABC transporter permease [Spirochaetaceae bacterium]